MSEALAPRLDNDVVRLIHDRTKARALAAHDAVMDRLIAVLGGENDKAAMTAAALILKVGGSMKAPSVKVQVSFDELIKSVPAQAGPLSGLTQIVESAAIDGDVDDDNE